MEKRVDFSTLLLQLAKNNTCELLFCDEMSFFAYKNRAKRLAPKNHEKVFFENPTPSRHDPLCISTFMTKDHVVEMTFRYQNTDTKLFLAELLPVLLKAHRKIDPRKKIVLILDNARYHPEAEIKKLLETASNSSHERGGFVRQFEIQFTSPNSPDLNLVEYYNRYFKSALRRALELFSFLTFNRPAQQRGRKPNPAAKPKKNPKPPAPRPIVTVFSKANLLTLAKYVCEKIIKAERRNGNWQHALHHIVKWAKALIKSDGSLTKATAIAAQDDCKPAELTASRGRVYDVESNTLVSARQHSADITEILPPPYIDFTNKELEGLVVEGRDIDPVLEQEQHESDLDDELEADLFSDTSDDSNDDIAPRGPIKRKFATQGGRQRKKQKRK